ncbi:unnamed protein product [Prorocentrum cordatum]|uniref:Nucleotide-diphospho-sugar transferase domain-containing protein n=1 Tax=Prorocentrum cordatum TaxID=2364126 RepID=A0ABN9RXU0_9DINO|nr:unnamed protein product [Polarella glacialis]
MLDAALTVEATRHHKQLKYERLLHAFRVHSGAAGAIWVDGDTWLQPAGGGDLERFMRLTKHHDFVIGRDHQDGENPAGIWSDLAFGYPPDESGVCSSGVNSGVFWVRRSAFMIEWMARLVGAMNQSDQCLINYLIRCGGSLVSEHKLVS